MSKLKETEYYEFAKWYSMPKFVRQEMGLPLTQKEFGEKYNVSGVSLSHWSDEVNFHDDVKRARTKWARGLTSEVIMGLFRKATTGEGGDATAAEKWMQWFGEVGVEDPQQTPKNATKRITAEAFLNEEGEVISSKQTSEMLSNGNSQIES